MLDTNSDAHYQAWLGSIWPAQSSLEHQQHKRTLVICLCADYGNRNLFPFPYILMAFHLFTYTSFSLQCPDELHQALLAMAQSGQEEALILINQQQQQQQQRQQQQQNLKSPHIPSWAADSIIISAANIAAEGVGRRGGAGAATRGGGSRVAGGGGNEGDWLQGLGPYLELQRVSQTRGGGVYVALLVFVCVQPQSE